MKKLYSLLMTIIFVISISACNVNPLRLRGDNQARWDELQSDLLSLDYVSKVQSVEVMNTGTLDIQIIVTNECDEDDIDAIFSEIVFPAFANNNDLLTMVYDTEDGPGLSVQVLNKHGDLLAKAISFDVAHEIWEYNGNLLFLHDYLTNPDTSNSVVFDDYSCLYDIDESIRGETEHCISSDENIYIYEIFVYSEFSDDLFELYLRVKEYHDVDYPNFYFVDANTSVEIYSSEERAIANALLEAFVSSDTFKSASYSGRTGLIESFVEQYSTTIVSGCTEPLFKPDWIFEPYSNYMEIYYYNGGYARINLLDQ